MIQQEPDDQRENHVLESEARDHGLPRYDLRGARKDEKDREACRESSEVAADQSVADRRDDKKMTPL